MRIYFFVLFVFVALLSCDKDDSNNNCTTLEIAYVTDVQAPETGVVGEDVEIDVSFGVRNSCGTFADFIQQQNENTRIVEIKAKYEGCVCLQVAETITTTYTYKPLLPGDYVFQFKSGEDQYITVNISVL